MTRKLPIGDLCEVSDPRIHHPHGEKHADHDGDHDHDHEDHDHGHSHHHHRETDKSRLLFALGISVAVLAAEVTGGILSHSVALLSDATHVLTDLSAQILSLLALLIAARPADAKRTFGYYRLEILAALANGVLLVALSAFLIVHAWARLHARVVVHTDLVIPVAAAGLVMNGAGAYVLHHAKTLNVRGAYIHVLSDLAALLAVLLGATLMHFKPSYWFIDPILGMVIAVAVVWSAVQLLREATDVLLEAVPSDIDLERVREDVRKLPGIEDVHDLHIWTITSGLHALSAHIVVKRAAPMSDNDELLKSVKALLLHNHRIAHSTLQIESQDYEHVMPIH